MVLKRNIQVGKNNFKLIYLVFLFYFCLILNSSSKSNLDGAFTDLKVLDKISSKNTLLKLENGKLKKFKDLEIIAKSKGFLLVSSSPLTRSSYHADEDFAKLKKNRQN